MTRPLLTPEEIWRKYDAMEARLSAPLSERMIELAALRPGMRVLDLATGRGEPAISAAKRVAPSGSVLGVDLSAPMLQMARERASAEGVANLELRVLNAESLDGVPDEAFDVAFVRWGLMYMTAPVRALEEVRRTLKPGGKLIAALWAEPERVSYHSLPRKVLEKYRPLPPIDFDAPGVFRYADPKRFEEHVKQAGLRVDHLEELDVPVVEAKTASELIEWVRAFGLTKLLNELPEEAQRAWEANFANEAERLRRDGVIRLGGTTIIATAIKV